ncbi:MAG: DUF3500 domain-containing protein [Usitatibacter sp.]
MFAPRLARIACASLFALSCLPAKAQDAPGARMRVEAQALIAAVDAGKRSRLVLPLADPRRADWHYTPRSRPGLAFGELDATQRESVHRLLRSALSSVGHRKVLNIIELELVLREIETFGLLRDPEKYSVVFFGAPDVSQPWGWRFEGHHLSLNFTLRGDAAVATTPSFFGANPAEVRKGPRQGLRVLAREEDEARQLLDSLDVAQRRAAIVDSRSYGDIVTGAKDRVAPLDNRGMEARTLDAAQKAQLKRLIEVYADSFEPNLRAERLARANEDFDSVRFAWAGATERGKPHYYRVQGTRFLIEYDSSQNDGNHVHTVWRDFNGDFGRDLLREHHTSRRH